MIWASMFSLRSFIFLLGFSAAVYAHDNPWTSVEDNAAWRAECGACHMAFPPGMLSSGEWSRIMSELSSHFGANASLDPPVQQEIAGYLERNGDASSRLDPSGNLPRITMTDRFVAKHRSAIRLWRKGQVKSLSDCMACHTSQR
jgi:hypothetical protein